MRLSQIDEDPLRTIRNEWLINNGSFNGSGPTGRRGVCSLRTIYGVGLCRLAHFCLTNGPIPKVPTLFSEL